MVLIVVIVILLWPRCQDERSCFVERANACKTATIAVGYAGSTLMYRTSDCILQAEFESFGAAEPKEVVDAFTGKIMRCPYTKGSFDEGFLDEVSYDLDACSGPLKDLLAELRNFEVVQ